MNKLLIGLCATLLAGTAFALPMYELDTFDSGMLFPPVYTNYNSIETLPTPTTYGDITAPTTWGGTRYWQLNVSDPDPIGRASVAFYPPTGLGYYNNDSGVAGYLILAYGALGGVIPGTGTPQNDSWIGISGVRFGVFDVDGTGGKLEVQILANGTLYTRTAFSIPTVDNVYYDILFTEFTPAGLPANLGDVDGIRWTFSGDPGWDIQLYYVGLTPEPTTLTLLGLGALALARRRRKS